MKALIVSQPKSGTYLCANILQNLGLTFTYMHLGIDTYDKYDPNNLENGRKDPRKYRQRLHITEAQKLIGDNEFAVTHSAAQVNTPLFDEFKKIVLYRNKSEAADSYNLWIKESGRPWPRRTIIQQIDETIPNSFSLAFDDMVNKNIDAINDLQKYLFGAIVFDSLSVIEKS
jgi:hypothetical protein